MGKLEETTFSRRLPYGMTLSGDADRDTDRDAAASGEGDGGGGTAVAAAAAAAGEGRVVNWGLEGFEEQKRRLRELLQPQIDAGARAGGSVGLEWLVLPPATAATAGATVAAAAAAAAADLLLVDATTAGAAAAAADAGEPEAI